MRVLILFIGCVPGAGDAALARDDIESSRFQSFVAVLGPITVSHDQDLKLCSTDVSVVMKSGAGDEERRWYGGRAGTGGEAAD